MIAPSNPTARPLADSTDSLLRFAMRADATLTGFFGLIAAALADPSSSLTGLTPVQGYSLGAFAVLSGLAVFSLAALPNLRHAGIGIAVGNVACTAAALALVDTAALPLTRIGVVAVLAGGVYTAVFALLQYPGVRRLRA